MTQEQKREYNRQWHEKNRDAVLEKQKKYRDKNKDKASDYNKAYHAKNKDKIKKRKIESGYYEQYREKNKDIIKERSRARYRDNVVEINAKRKVERKDNAGRIKEEKKRYYEKYKEKISTRSKGNRNNRTPAQIEKDKEKAKLSSAKHRDKNRIRCREFYYSKRDEILEKEKENYKNRTEEEKQIDRKARRDYIATNINAKISCNLRGRLNMAIKRGYKAGSAVRDLGCCIDYFKEYMEKMFVDGMSWENYGPKTWHIDHKIPLCSFDLTIREQLLSACHYTNLQPLWAKDNLSKHRKIAA